MKYGKEELLSRVEDLETYARKCLALAMGKDQDKDQELVLFLEGFMDSLLGFAYPIELDVPYQNKKETCLDYALWHLAFECRRLKHDDDLTQTNMYNLAQKWLEEHYTQCECGRWWLFEDIAEGRYCETCSRAWPED